MKRLVKDENGTYYLIGHLWYTLGTIKWSNKELDPQYPNLIRIDEVKSICDPVELSLLFEKYPELFELMLD